MVDGHNFDHYFFVSKGSVGNTYQDIILGQPWLQWYSASLSYTRDGAMKMCIWKDGQGDESGVKATVSISLCTSNAPRNAHHLDLSSSQKLDPDKASQHPHHPFCPKKEQLYVRVVNTLDEEN